MNRESVNLGTMANVRAGAYHRHMENTVQQGICPLCDLDPELNVVLKEGEYWRAWRNPFGYPHQTHHFIIATKDHCTQIADISPTMWAELGDTLEWLCNRFDILGGGIVLRFGDPAYSASTLRHLHVHIHVPDKTGYVIAVFCKSSLLKLFFWLDGLLKRGLFR